MDNQKIKEMLFIMFEKEFNINTKVGITDRKTDTFIHSISFQYKDKKDKWHDVSMKVCGTIYKNLDAVYGISKEKQTEGIHIKSWEFNEIEVYIDGKSTPLITFEELYSLIK